MKIELSLKNHACQNLTNGDYGAENSDDCETCGHCRCEDSWECCRNELYSAYCPDCGRGAELPMCYTCNGETCGACEVGEHYPAGEPVYFTGKIIAEWNDQGALVSYKSTTEHPHITRSNHCINECAPLFQNVKTPSQAIHAILTHVSNINFYDALHGGPYDGLSK